MVQLITCGNPGTKIDGNRRTAQRGRPTPACPWLAPRWRRSRSSPSCGRSSCEIGERIRSRADSKPLSSNRSPRAALKCSYRGDSMTRDWPVGLRVRMHKPRRGMTCSRCRRGPRAAPRRWRGPAARCPARRRCSRTRARGAARRRLRPRLRPAAPAPCSPPRSRTRRRARSPVEKQDVEFRAPFLLPCATGCS